MELLSPGVVEIAFFILIFIIFILKRLFSRISHVEDNEEYDFGLQKIIKIRHENGI